MQSLQAAEAVALQMGSNDLLAEAVRRRPDRFEDVATLATSAPKRLVSGTVS